MGKKIKNLKDLFIEQGRELYDSSIQEEKQLGIIENHAWNTKLKNVINRQLSTARDQRDRLTSAFKTLNTQIEGEKNECSQAVLRKTQSLIDRSHDQRIKDAVIINSIQRLNHTKIAGLGSLASYAKEIGHPEIAHSIQETLEQEKAIDRELSDLAEKEINQKALTSLLM
jgi:ferritin-like metal-binding protein YciE